MFSNYDLEKVKKIVQEFFDKTGFEVRIENPKMEKETFFVKIKTEEPQILIGRNGQTLGEIQRLLKALLKKIFSRHFYLDLDINNYKKKKMDYLKETACSLADEVALTGKEKKLMPMSAYERRVVHLELAEREDVLTQSVGEGRERILIIKPK